MNTDGGVLLIGVDDAGEILGLDADEFANAGGINSAIENLANCTVRLLPNKKPGKDTGFLLIYLVGFRRAIN